MLTVNEQGQEIAADKARKINDEEAEPSEVAHKRAEQVQADHVQDKMHPAHMQEAGSKEAPVFLVFQDAVDLKFVVVEKDMISEAFVGDRHINSNDHQSYDPCFCHK